MSNKPNYKLKAQVIGNGCAKLERQNALNDWLIEKYKSDLFGKSVEELNEIIKIEHSSNITEVKKQLLDYEFKTKIANQKFDISVKLLECLRKKIEYQQELTNYTNDELSEAYKVNQASYKRVKRLKQSVNNMIEQPNAIFVTLTFRDDVLVRTSQQTRRDYVRKYLKTECKSYIANIDYGGENGREHYHALVVPINKDLNYKQWFKKCGTINFKRVWHYKDENDFTKSAERISKYVSKLTNHAIKESTKRANIIYSR